MTRSLGARHGVEKGTVARVWEARHQRPWRVDTFKSTDADVGATLTDVVGTHLDPPERAVVFSFDEKTQCQALGRTRPSLLINPGRGHTMTRDYKRNGTVDLPAAMNVATGDVLHDTRRRHAGADVFIPTGPVAVNLVEWWFNELATRRLRAGPYSPTSENSSAPSNYGRALKRRP
ncbi:MAG: hypothetical protein M3548_02005 [Actinomycetota bacterium]|nr:hypothetical protein [Actinomycetota bacterium]